MSDILDVWYAHLADVVASTVEATRNERESLQLLRDAEAARLRRQIEEDKARAEFLQLTREELAQFRAWLRERGNNWQECER